MSRAWVLTVAASLAACMPVERHILVVLHLAEGVGADVTDVHVAVAHDGPRGRRDATLPDGGSGPIDFPADLVVLIGDASGVFVTNVEALDRDGTEVARGSSEVTVSEGGDGRVATVTVTLDAGGGCVPPSPEGPATCRDGLAGLDETDVDCGGPCAPCGPGRGCRDDGDCTSGACIDEGCGFASGPPFWLPATPLTRARAALAATTGGDGMLYVLGGTDGAPLAAVERLDPDTGAWSVAPDMPRARYALSAITDRAGRIWAIGGDDGASTLADVSIFDPQASAWTPGEPMGTPRAAFVAVASTDGPVFALAGRSGDEHVRSVERNDDDGDGWAAAADLQSIHSSHAAAMGPDGAIYVLDSGGTEIYRPGGAPGDLEGLDPARDRLAAVFGPDGRLYATGGVAGGPLDDVFAYTPALERWEVVSSIQPRGEHAVTVAPDGRIFAFGGDGPGGLVDAVEAYGPVAQLWRGEEALPAGGRVRGAELLAVRGENFAADARVSIALSANGCAAAEGRTDEDGRIVEPIEFRVPAVEKLEVVVRDDRSGYPVTLRATVDGDGVR